MKRFLALAGITWTAVMIRHSTAGVPWDRWSGLALSGLDPVFPVLAVQALRLLGAAFFIFLLYGLGSALLRRLGAWPEEGTLAISSGIGAGAAVAGTGLFLLGLAGLWSKALFWVLTAAAAVFGFLQVRGGKFPKIVPASEKPWAAAAAAAWLFALPWALAPETFYDALEYHLALPQLYLLRGGIVPTPENSFSGIPSIPSMLFGWTLAFDAQGGLAQLLHWSFFPVCALAVVGLSRRLGAGRHAWTAAALFAWTPVVISESFRVSVGLESALFQTCAAAAYLAAASAEHGRRRGPAAACGIFLGAAMSSKYPALLLWPAAAACALGEHRRLRWTRREWAGLLLLPLLALAPWLIKNQIFYGNPLFPFFHERIRPEALHMPSWSYLSQGGLELSALLSREGFMSFLRQPWDFSRHASDFGGSLGPAWLALCPLLFMARGSEVRRLGVWALFTWLPLAAVSSITRYFIPVLASSAALWGAGLAAAEAKGWRWAGRCAAAAMGAVALAYATMILPRMATLRAAVGSVSRWDYLKATSFASHTPTPPHAGFEFLEAHAPRTAKVLIFGDARAFPLSRDFTAASADQRSVLEVWADQAGSEEALAEKFYSEGITHVLVNHAEIFRNRTALRFSRRGKAALDGFWARRTLKVFQDAVPGDRWVAVYRILDEAEAASPHDADDLFAAYRVR